MTFGSLNYLKQPSLLGPIDPICWSFCFTFKVLEVEMGEEDLFFFFFKSTYGSFQEVSVKTVG